MIMEKPKAAKAPAPYWHRYNPWEGQIVYVPIERLAECVAGGTIGEPDGSISVYDVERVLKHFRQAGHERLDAYILPHPSGENSLGVRWGEEPEQYFSPHNAHPSMTQKLLEEFQ